MCSSLRCTLNGAFTLLLSRISILDVLLSPSCSIPTQKGSPNVPNVYYSECINRLLLQVPPFQGHYHSYTQQKLIT
ncbi:uncharacterized protein F5147DRAFT_718338 [Suillus discolor]|uniref:Secreted protein n=1 Tax=Suillus discolor TaxID=1912936 RepID=A0A9P7JPD2_9AGAM|nr:uncharacterized protein F5147DRAFT_718338 [Suillus discolor]KAG2095452.1 hypothetical protein F5147DRAFT_718338 [Suillus discolor]